MPSTPAIKLTDVQTGESYVLDAWQDPLYSDTWTDKTGRVWQFGDMETSYIINVIRFVRRRATPLAMRALAAMESWAASPLGAGGDMATDAQDRALEEVWEAANFGGKALERVEQSPLIRALKEELARRDEPWGEV